MSDKNNIIEEIINNTQKLASDVFELFKKEEKAILEGNNIFGFFNNVIKKEKKAILVRDLYKAINVDNYETVESLIRGTSDINTTEALIYAAEKGKSKSASILIENGADINIKNKEGNTALIYAAENKNSDLAKILIENGADINIKNKEGKTALAIASNDTEFYGKLIHEVANKITKDKTERSTTFLIPSLTQSQQEGVEKNNSLGSLPADILEKIAGHDLTPNHQKETLSQALSISISLYKSGRIEITDLEEHITSLKTAEVDLNIKNEKGNTTLMEAVKNISRNNNSNGYIVQNPTERLNHINQSLAEILIENGANLDIQNNNGYTALIYAAENENLDLAKKLIDSGANLDIQDNQGYTALMEAATCNNSDLTEKLIDSGANLDIQNNNGYTALIYAARKNSDLAKKLIVSDADVNIKNKEGNTALIYAARNKNSDLAKILIENGADINIKNKEGNTALIYAAENKNSDLAKILIENGADINIKNKEGKTALAIASNDMEFFGKLLQTITIKSEATPPTKLEVESNTTPTHLAEAIRKRVNSPHIPLR
jgi:ankyrin repeat protein